MALALTGSPMRAQPQVATPDAAWSKVAVAQTSDGAWTVSLESDLLRLDYGPDIRPGSTTVCKALALVHKPSGQKIGPFDSRYSPSRTEFLTVRHAEPLRTRSPDEVAVRLYFLTRVLDVTLIRGTTFARFEYTFLNDSRHTYDQMAVPGAPEISYFFSGQKAYSEHMGWFASSDPKKEAAYAPYPFSFYRNDWAGGRYLDHQGWLIIGAGAPGKLGYGAILPLAQVRWLKLMARSGGLERMMTGNATVYYYLVPEFSAERGRQAGEEFISRLKRP
jgi:hypothetical protein